MQSVASEMKHAETAFVWAKQDGVFGLRWFTPTVEVALCGHATLASAHVLWSTGRLKTVEQAQFQTLYSGELVCRKVEEKIEMNFPSEAMAEVPCPEGLAEALGVEMLWTGINRMDYLVELSTDQQVRELNPNLDLLAKIPVRGVIVTAKAEVYDFVSRFFAPASGVPEDPVTGSAHCALGPFWSSKLNKTQLKGFQASPRGGEVGVEILEDRVLLTGEAFTVLSGELSI
jgi:PhzF family phenazine biosynthesis protein